MQGTMLVGTAGQGVLRSNDDGATWNRIPLDQDLEFDAVVRALAVHPTTPEVIFAGADVGLGRGDDGGTRWTRVDAPFNDSQVWAIAIDPNDPDSMLVGTGAPSRMTTPMPTRPRSLRLPVVSLPVFSSSPMSGADAMIRSACWPVAMTSRRKPVGPVVKSNLWPVCLL